MVVAIFQQILVLSLNSERTERLFLELISLQTIAFTGGLLMNILQKYIWLLIAFMLLQLSTIPFIPKSLAVVCSETKSIEPSRFDGVNVWTAFRIKDVYANCDFIADDKGENLYFNHQTEGAFEPNRGIWNIRVRRQNRQNQCVTYMTGTFSITGSHYEFVNVSGRRKRVSRRDALIRISGTDGICDLSKDFNSEIFLKETTPISPF